MPRRPLLTADQWSVFLDMSADEENLIRHCTLSRPDLDVIAAKRAAHNRLGLALQICFLRHLGRVLLPGEAPPAAMAVFVAEQVGVDPASLAEYRRRATNRREHAVEAQGYRPLDSLLVAAETFNSRKDQGGLNLGVPTDADIWIAQKQRELDFKLKRMSYRARTGKLAGVRLVDGVMLIAKQRTKVPKAKVDAAKWLILDRLPQIDITELLAEVNAWTGFALAFTHLRTGDQVRNPPALLAAVLGDATNLGAKRMADASAGLTERQITWARLFHVRPETYRTALAAIINAHLTSRTITHSSCRHPKVGHVRSAAS